MAGTVTTTEETFGTIKKITFDWLSSAGGAADATTVSYYSGLLWRAVLVPDGGGTQPTDAYDVVVNDDDSVDILNGAGANASNVTTGDYVAILGLSAVANAQLTLAVTNAGNAKGGQVILYIR